MTIKSGTTLLLRLGLLALCLAVPKLARAQEPAKPADPPPDPDKVTLNFFRNTEIGGLIDTYWLYNSNKVNPSYQAFDVLYNSFDVSMAELWVAKSPTADSRIGYKIRTTFGSASKNQRRVLNVSEKPTKSILLLTGPAAVV